MIHTPANAARILREDWHTIPPPDGPWDDPVLDQLADTDVAEIVDPPLIVVGLTPEPTLRRRNRVSA